MNEVIDCWDVDLDRDAEQRFVECHGHVNEIAVGTVLEYDGWQWAVVTELAADRDEPMFGFVLVDELGDAIIKRLEKAGGCRQHYEAVKHLRDGDHEYWTPVDYVVTDDIWTVRGPVHPGHRDDSPEADHA
ncbi:hypothetical protein [Haloarcula sp. Atlit-120R]|uniref:hypothetical protein n=1 Tax=Haloarcula sp. Atlit-120R TaxID=2282135 RepID=UPI000EF1D69B|nr:hypothetical protein [Haloarcula sp. Atlit-120R]RLM32642.1 hypothetical protein DVK01_20430 [Haloarcula sp. Atlit-120R]